MTYDLWSGLFSRSWSIYSLEDQTSPEEFEINKIIKGRYNKDGNIEYLIDWKGYPSSARTYEPEENLNEAAREYVKVNEIPMTGRKQDH